MMVFIFFKILFREICLFC